MNFNINMNVINISNPNLKENIKKLSNLYLEEILKGNKVAYYYEDIKSKTTLSFNEEICFYAASSIKILVCLIIFEQASKNKINIEEKILISIKDLKQGTGTIKNQIKDTKYSILELIKLCLVESDNTAYIKLVNIIGKQHIEEYGKSLGAKHTMEGKDSFGIINCQDMIIYWQHIKEFIDNNKKYGHILKNYLSNPTLKLIKNSNIDNELFIRKYGSFGIAYHEAGYVDGKTPYYLIILTQLNEKEYKEQFINETAKIISKIHKIINDNN